MSAAGRWSAIKPCTHSGVGPMPDGTSISSPHRRHLMRFPAVLSAALILAEHAGQTMEIGIAGVPEKRGASNPTPLPRTPATGRTKQRPADAPFGARSERCLCGIQERVSPAQGCRFLKKQHSTHASLRLSAAGFLGRRLKSAPRSMNTERPAQRRPHCVDRTVSARTLPQPCMKKGSPTVPARRRPEQQRPADRTAFRSSSTKRCYLTGEGRLARKLRCGRGGWGR
jgi:hypothetical protein